MAAISIDLRIRIIEAYDRGEGTRQEIADRFCVSLGFVKKLISQRNKSGTIEPQYQNVGRKKYFTEERSKQLKVLVDSKPDLTLAEIKKELGLTCSIPTIHYALKDLEISYKKRL